MRQLRDVLPCKARDDLLKNECDRQGESNGHYSDTPM